MDGVPSEGVRGTLIHFEGKSFQTRTRDGRMILTWKCHQMDHFFEEDITDALPTRVLTPIPSPARRIA
jgi:hypothetical protein